MRPEIENSLEISIKEEYDLINVRKGIRELSQQLEFNIVNQTKLLTAASELARNILLYAKSGFIRIYTTFSNDKKGIALEAIDDGPGIEDIEMALKEGYSTGNGLGKGLSGTKCLMDYFEMNSELGKGTYIKIIKWK